VAKGVDRMAPKVPQRLPGWSVLLGYALNQLDTSTDTGFRCLAVLGTPQPRATRASKAGRSLGLGV
jgi:hypothetical protein